LECGHWGRGGQVSVVAMVLCGIVRTLTGVVRACTHDSQGYTVMSDVVVTLRVSGTRPVLTNVDVRLAA
jgi:hypothetical protein